MKIVIAPDSFKECLPAEAVAEAMAAGWRRVFPHADVMLVPMADGGEGTVAALTAATGGELISAEVTGPYGAPVLAEYGVLGDGYSAVIEMASASGLALAPAAIRDPRIATTRGTGELIVHALERGITRLIVGIGGSATNDGGAGAAQALGYRLLDAEGAELPPGGAALSRLRRIDATGRHPELDGCEIRVACDVDNPLCGPRGASAVFGPQKGADAPGVAELDAALAHYAGVVEAELGVPVLDMAGGGAAGGLGAGLVAFAGARLESGVALVAEACGLEEKVRTASLVLTGEGRMDGQSAGGKTPVGVARTAKRHNVPVVALVGMLGAGYEDCHAAGIDVILSISQGPSTVAQAIAEAPARLRDAAEAVARMWKLRGMEWA